MSEEYTLHLNDMDERFSDPLDAASQEIDKQMNIGLAKIRAFKPLQSDGKCKNCNDDIDGSLLFCDSDCRDDYEFINNRKRANRRV